MSISRDIATWLASESRKGPVELATQAEVDAGTDAERIVTPATLGDVLAAGGLIDQQVFTANGTWTKPAGCKLVEVHAVGGGGGGAGAGITGSVFRFGGGGGGGGYSSGYWLASGWGATVTVVIGSGGAGGAAGQNDGAAGGNSTFNGLVSPYLSAVGGGAGTKAASDDTFGGNGTGGSANHAGQITDTALSAVGMNGSRHGCVGITYQNLTGGAASGPWSGAQNVVAAKVDSGTYADAGDDGPRPGCGGGGAAVRGATGSAAGGDGADGIIIVRSYG
jgi:hypothetical protein